MLQESSRPVTAHKLEMQNRNHVDLTGITEVISFDNKEIELETVEGAAYVCCRLLCGGNFFDVFV